MSVEEVSWVGASGIEYRYFVFPLDVVVPARLGLYIYSKNNSEDRWDPLYVGHGDIAARGADADLLAAIRAKGASHVHLRLVTREEDRLEEWHDLLSLHARAFAPEGCQPESDRPAVSQKA